MYPAKTVLVLQLIVSSAVGCLPNKYLQLIKDFSESLDSIFQPAETQCLEGGAWVAEGYDTQFECPDEGASANLLVWYHEEKQMGFCKQTDNSTWMTFTKKCSCSVMYAESSCNLNVINVDEEAVGVYTCQMFKDGAMVNQHRFRLLTGDDSNEHVFSPIC